LHHPKKKGYSKEIQGLFPKGFSGYKFSHQYSANESLEKNYIIIKQST
jgi:hypothetical protein